MLIAKPKAAKAQDHGLDHAQGFSNVSIQDETSARDMPLNRSPLFVVIDVYGTTKQIRIIQLEGILSLQSACRNVILEHFMANTITKLPLPD